MIVVKSVNDFCEFVNIATAKEVPFQIIYCERHIGTSIGVSDREPNAYRFVLLCSLFTIYTEISLTKDTKEVVNKLLTANSAVLFSKLDLKNGTISIN